MAHYCMGLRRSVRRLSGRPDPPQHSLPRPDRRGMVRTAVACKAVRVAAYVAWGAGLMPVPSLLWNMAQLGVDAGSEATMRPLAERVGGAGARGGRAQGAGVEGGVRWGAGSGIGGRAGLGQGVGFWGRWMGASWAGGTSGSAWP